MTGANLQTQLEQLSENFDAQTRPKYGRYVQAPAKTDLGGMQQPSPAPQGQARRWLLPVLS